MRETDLHASVFDWLDDHINLERNPPNFESGKPWDAGKRLASARRLYSLLDDPQLKFDSIHVTGTNGKTSTSGITSQLLLAMGLRTGTYTSPHLQVLNERIAIDGAAVSDAELVEALGSVRLLEQMIPDEDRPTYFEVLTAAAFRVFADAPIDAGVIEVGLGGTYDSTNALDAPVCVITNIGEDHMNYLGPTRADIARQKAGIVTANATLVTAETDPEMLAIFEERSPARMYVLGRDFEVTSNKLAVGGRLLDIRTPKGHYEDLFVSLHGSHQGINAAVSLVAAEAFFGEVLPADIVAQAMASLQVPGRMEIAGRSPLCILDGAHNADAAAKLTAAIDEEFGAERDRVLVIGMLSPHHPSELLRSLQAGRARLVIACRAPSPRAVDPAKIAAQATALGTPAVVVEDVGAALEEALAASTEDTVVLVSGSLYVAGAARDHLGEQG